MADNSISNGETSKPEKVSFVDVDAERDVNLNLDYNVADERLNAVVRQMGLTRLRKVQAVAIQRGLFFRKSLLVISPSGSGKTLVGELAAANCILEGLGKAAYLVPLKALATEKYKHFQRHYARLGIKVEISIGYHAGASQHDWGGFSFFFASFL